jgi:hypothetical protein
VKRAASLLLVLAGCASDPCAPFADQACVAVEVRAGTSGATEIDQVELSSAELHLAAALTPAVPDRQSLPIIAPIEAGAFDGTYALTVRARLQGSVVGAGTVTAQPLGANAHTHLIVDLQPPAAVSAFTVVQGSVSGESFNAIWGADADKIFVVGTNGIHLDHFQGSWNRQQNSLGRNLFAVWGRNAHDVYAVGELSNGQGVVEHFNGLGWQDEYIAASGLRGVWGVDPVILAVGSDGMLYGKGIGTTDWGTRLMAPLQPNPDVSIPPGTPVLYGITGNGINDFVMPGGLDRFWHYEGFGNYVYLDPQPDSTIDFRSAWAVPGTTTNVFLGTNYLGIDWLNVGTPPPGAMMLDDMLYRISDDESPGNEQLYIRGIYGLGSKVVFVGDGGHIYSFDVGLSEISPVLSPTEDSLGGVWGATDDDVWIVGDRELVLHGSLAP